MQFGLNLAGVTNISPELPFANLFLCGGHWISQEKGKPYGGGPALDLDAHGWVKSLGADCQAQASFCPLAYQYWPGATITCTYDGEGTVAFYGSVKTLSSSPGVLTGAITGQSNIGIMVSINSTNPTNYVRNIRLRCPDLPASYTDVFRQPFLSRWGGLHLSAVRLMDWMTTNGNPEVNWTDRKTPAAPFWSGPGGVPLEWCLEAARRLNASPWVCVPHMATDDYVLQMAELIKSNLQLWQKIYVEYSNECWNTATFSQAGYCLQQGKAAQLSTNDFQAQLRWYSQRAVQVHAIFAKVFSGTSQLVRVMSAQAVSPWTSQQVLGWQDAGHQVDALAIAPYFGAGLGNAKNAPTTATYSVQQVLDACMSDIQGHMLQCKQAQAALAQQYGIELVAYESGQSLIAATGGTYEPTLLPLFTAANRDPGMKDCYYEDFKSWESVGGGLFNLFTSMAGPSINGCWGLLETELQDPATAPKLAAVKQFLST